MRFKSNKDALISRIQSEAWATQLSPDNFSLRQKGDIEFAINNAIFKAFKALLDDVYTDEEFEKDIGLKD